MDDGGETIGDQEINAPFKKEVHSKYHFDQGQMIEGHEVNVAVEKPLEIRINRKPYSIVMRTPPVDPTPAIGFCFTEGLFDDYEAEVGETFMCPHFPPGKRVVVFLKGDAKERFLKSDASGETKAHAALSSCGMCGKQTVEEAFVPLCAQPRVDKIKPTAMRALMDVFKERQEIFGSTGATHAAAIFSASGELIGHGEDIGRHNALDKAIGETMLVKPPVLKDVYFALLSSRISFEMMQKAIRAGVQVVAGVSAATSQAVALAAKFNVTLIGFWRRGSFVVYTHPERIDCGGE